MARPSAIVPVKQDEHFINWAVYGEPGVGKSVLAGTGSRTLLLLNDNDESSSAASMGSEAHKWVIPTYDEMEEAYQYLLHEGCKFYDWVWLDNATLLQEQGMFDDIMVKLVASKPSRNRWVPDQHEYLVNQNQLATYIRYFKALPIHFGVTFHSMRAEDDDGRIIYLPMLQGGQGALSQKVCGYMNLVSYMYVQIDKEGEHRRIQNTKRGKFYAKTRWAGVPGSIENPTVPKVEALIKAKFPALGKPQAATTSKRRTA